MLVEAWPKLSLARPHERLTLPGDVGHRAVMSSSALALDRSALRRRLLTAFDRERLEILCADINARFEKERSDVRVSPEIVGGRGLEAIILNLIEYLDRRGLLTYLLDAVRMTQPGLI